MRNRTLLALACLLPTACLGEPSAPEATGEDAGLSETVATLHGELRNYVEDREDGSYREGFSLKLANGEHVELSFAEPPREHVGSQVSLSGAFETASGEASDASAMPRFVVSDLLVDTLRSTARADQALRVLPQTTHRAAIVLLNFEGMAPQNYSVETARKELDEVEAYYHELSFGKLIVDIDLFGPFEVPAPNHCDLSPMVSLAKQAAREHGISMDGYEHIGAKIPDLPGYACPCGVAYLGNTPAQGGMRNGGESLYTCSGANAFAHEMGHGFGLNHASAGRCDGKAYRRGLTGCEIDEYGNPFNTMGNGLGHMTAYQKATMGWTGACNNVRVRRSGVFDLEPIQVGTTAPQGLQIDTGDSREGGPLYYYVEYRNPGAATFNAKNDDSTRPREKGPGLHISVARDYRETVGESRPVLLDVSPNLTGFGGDGDPRLKPGQVYVDPNRRVTIQLLSMSPKRARVKVSFPFGGSGTNKCQDDQTPPAVSGDPRNDPPFPQPTPPKLYQHCDFGGWSVELKEGNYRTADLAALGAFDNDASSLDVGDGYEITVFDADNFAGPSVTYSSASACFVSRDFNDRASSIRVRKLP